MDKIIGDCFICFEETPLLSPCLCKNVYLCENCLEKLRIYNFTECKVCNSEYPKKNYQTEIDINFLLNEERHPNYSLTPCCFRPRSERGNPKYCLFDMFTHLICIYLIMITISCVSNDSECYGIQVLWFTLPALIIYIIISLIISSLIVR